MMKRRLREGVEFFQFLRNREEAEDATPRPEARRLIQVALRHGFARTSPDS